MNPKSAVAADLRRCMTLAITLPCHLIMCLATGPLPGFLQHLFGKMTCR